MNILLLSQFFSTTRGGGEYVFSLIAKKLAENNHRVFVITNRIEGEKYEQRENIRVTFVPPTLEYSGGLPPGFSDNIRYTINAIRQGLATRPTTRRLFPTMGSIPLPAINRPSSSTRLDNYTRTAAKTSVKLITQCKFFQELFLKTSQSCNFFHDIILLLR
ncbi:MAG: hypothetical protein KGI25_00115 [Thaumarchaeota archaeon]|nr:hypothetical protein [Nitrososphaerota archaeon]